MLFNVNVVSRAEFEQHMEELRAKGQTGKLESERVNYTGERPSEGRTL
jgi:hypothetical protein